MTERLSLGPVQISSMDLGDINRALEELRNRIDELFGLRGNFTVHSNLTIDRVVHGTDKTTYTDANGTILHGFGNAV